jgi:hypothetical protein
MSNLSSDVSQSMKRPLTTDDDIDTRSSSHSSKHSRIDDTRSMIPNKSRHDVDRNRSASTAIVNDDSLSVPFWKQLNVRQGPNRFRTRSIGEFSLLTHNNTKQCFDDQRYLRSKFVRMIITIDIHSIVFFFTFLLLSSSL